MATRLSQFRTTDDEAVSPPEGAKWEITVVLSGHPLYTMYSVDRPKTRDSIAVEFKDMEGKLHHFLNSTILVSEL